MQNTQNDNEDAFDEVFASETNTTEVVVPEPVGGKTGKPEKGKLPERPVWSDTLFMVYRDWLLFSSS